MLLKPAPVSVIIPAYNAASSIERALLSIAAQTLPPAEIVVVDDGSQDDTATRARAMQKAFDTSALVVIEQKNQGAGAARNKAAHAATQEYLAFLDADDEWLPTKLERSMAVLAEGNYTLVAHDYLDATPDGDVHVSCASRFNEGPDPYTSLYLKGYIPSISVVVRRDAVIHVGGFDETLRNAQDFELWLKVLASPQATFTVFDEPLARYYHTPGGIMSHTERRIMCCVHIAHQYVPTLNARGGDAFNILVRRLANIYFESFSVYARSGKLLRALAIPARLVWAIVRASLKDSTAPVLAYSMWVVVIFGIYISQFRHLVGPIVDVIKTTFGAA